ncbi:MAG: hypothetical protein ACE5GX_17770 [Thermoanaerobaculia bacterium]
MIEVCARTWCRVDFAGGTLDIWPLGLLHPGAVTVNVAIDLATEVTLRPRVSGFRLLAGDRDETVDRPELWRQESGTALVGHLATALALPPAEIEVRSESPRGGGLGASSAIAMAFIAAAERFIGSPDSTAAFRSRLARDVEARMMALPTGLQDHLPALLGGMLVIHHEPGGERIERTEVDFEELECALVIAYSGQSHFSAGNNWKIVRRRLDGDQDTVGHFSEIARIAAAVAAAFRAGEAERVGELMSEEWRHRSALADGISTPKIESMLAAARVAGAWGGKACGAGGGGCVAVLVPAGRRDAVVESLSAVAEVLPASPCSRPFELTSKTVETG